MRLEASLTPSRAALVWLAIVAAALLARETAPVQRLELATLDAQFRFLRERGAKPVANDVVIVGIDETTLDRFPEPFALWHRHLGAVLRGLAAARPRAVGIDVELPERSYDFLQPGLDLALFDGLQALAAAAPVVIARGIDETGRVKPVHAPFLAAAGANGQGIPTWPLDLDLVVRRFDERQGDNDETVPTLTGVLARRLGAATPPGVLDFALGGPFDYIPLHEVAEWSESGEVSRLAAAFADRVVLLGAVLPFRDQHVLPVDLTSWERSSTTPGVLIHAQALRGLLGPGLVQPAPMLAAIAMLLLAASLWFAAVRPLAGAMALLAFVMAAAALSTWLLYRQTYLPIAAAVLTALAAGALRVGYEAWFNRRQRLQLRSAFAGAVSPNVLSLILAGKLDSEIGTGRRRIAVMFGDIRGFTPLTESAAPEHVVALLNRYFARVTDAVHAHGGTVDNFRGDGIMCIFGAPLATPEPCRDGFAAAQTILDAVTALNRELEQEGHAPIRIGLSLAYGDAVVGRVGAPGRNEYTAIGDVANVSARIEGLTAELGYPLLVSDSVVAALGEAARFDDLGERALKGHSPVHVHGWPARKPDARGELREIAA